MNRKLSNYWIVLLLIAILISILGFFTTSKSEQNKEEIQGEIRIVSLIPSLTQSIYYLEANNMLVGCTSYCKTTKEDSVEIVSSAIKSNVEKIVSLKPDIVLASNFISDKEIETLQRFGIRVEKFVSPKSFDEICSEFVRLGKLIGKERRANEIVNKSKVKLQEILDEIPKRDPKLEIFIQIGASPIYTVIPNMFMDDYIKYCGGVNIASEITSGTIGREFVVSRDPDIIFVVTMGIVGENEVEQWLKFSQMKAVVEQKIFVIDSEVACQPTPITFIETLELMNKYISE